MMNNENILEQIKQKYSNLLITDPDEARRVGYWVSECSPNDLLGELNETVVLLDCSDWSAEILTFPKLYSDQCFISIRYKHGGLRKLKSLRGTKCNFEAVSKILDDKEMIQKSLDYEEYHNQMLKPKRFDGNIVITDPAYIRNDDWDRDPDMDIYNGFGFDKVFGDTYIYGPTIYGDWSCTVYDCGEQDPKKIIEKAEEKRKVPTELTELGNFCADAGLVSVTYLEKSENIKKFGSHCWTMIPDFHGTVQYYQSHNKIYIVGISDDGIHNFVSFQTGL